MSQSCCRVKFFIGFNILEAKTRISHRHVSLYIFDTAPWWYYTAVHKNSAHPWCCLEGAVLSKTILFPVLEKISVLCSVMKILSTFCRCVFQLLLWNCSSLTKHCKAFTSLHYLTNRTLGLTFLCDHLTVFFFSRKERLIYVGISVENIIAPSVST